MPSLPTGVVTFLFTDIEGSTRLLTRAPDAYDAALTTHNSLLEAAVRANHGVIFETIGEAIYASFADPTDAVCAAIDSQRSLQACDWGAVGDLRVRMSLHRGPVEPRGRHYMGKALYQCQRLIALAWGQQVLVSSEVAALTRGGLPRGVSLIDLGPQHLRDFIEDQLVFQVAAPGLRADFPPLRAVRPTSGFRSACASCASSRAAISIAGVSRKLPASCFTSSSERTSRSR